MTGKFLLVNKAELDDRNKSHRNKTSLSKQKKMQQ